MFSKATRTQLDLVIEMCGQGKDLTNTEIRSLFVLFATIALSNPKNAEEVKNLPPI